MSERPNQVLRYLSLVDSAAENSCFEVVDLPLSQKEPQNYDGFVAFFGPRFENEKAF